MLDRVYVRSHVSFGADPIDVGALAEACLFYQKTDLVLGPGSLRQLLVTYGPDTIIELVSGGYVRVHLLDHEIGVMTRDVDSPAQRHLPVSVVVGGALESRVVANFREVTGRSGVGRRKAMAFLEMTHPMTLGPDWHDGVIESLRDERLLQRVVALTARHAVPGTTCRVTLDGVTEADDGFFRLHLGGDWERLRREYAARSGRTLSRGDLLTYFTETLTDLQLASRLQGEISTGEIGSELLALKCRELAAAANANQSNVARFQSHVLGSVDIRSAVNSGSRSLDDVMQLLDRSTRFRHWLDGKEFDADLVADYIKESVAGSWAATLPAKTLRLAILLSIGLAIAGPPGLLAGAVLSASDMFLLERIAGGWRPNQFVNRDLGPFTR